MSDLSESDSLSGQLFSLLGEEAFVRLCQAVGGTRLYVPTKIPEGHEIVASIGTHAAELLAREFSPDTIRIPLAREQRVRFYRKQGHSIVAIARKLGITENGVGRIIARISKREAPPSITS